MDVGEIVGYIVGYGAVSVVTYLFFIYPVLYLTNFLGFTERSYRKRYKDVTDFALGAGLPNVAGGWYGVENDHDTVALIIKDRSWEYHLFRSRDETASQSMIRSLRRAYERYAETQDEIRYHKSLSSITNKNVIGQRVDWQED